MSSTRSGLAVGLVLLSGCGQHAAQPPAAGKLPPVTVSTRSVGISAWPDGFEATGTVRAKAVTTVASRLMGYVREIRVREGDAVAEGQTLVILDSRDLTSAHKQAEAALAEARSGVPEAESAIRAARAQLDLARTTHRRMEDLLSKKSLAQQEYDVSAARLRAAESAVEMAEARRIQLNERIRQAQQAVESAAVALGYAEIRAPFAGRVVARKAEPGTMAAPGMPLLEIEQAGALRLEAMVDESRLGVVRTGMSVTVRLDAVEGPLTGRVSEITPAVEAASRTFPVKIDLPHRTGIRSGMFGRAEFALGQRRVLAAPASALVADGQVISVFVAEGDTARKRIVRTGASRGDEVEILAGLAEGDRLIHPRPAGLRDGDAIAPGQAGEGR